MLMRKGPIGVYGLLHFLDQKVWQSAVDTHDVDLVGGSGF